MAACDGGHTGGCVPASRRPSNSLPRATEEAAAGAAGAPVAAAVAAAVVEAKRRRSFLNAVSEIVTVPTDARSDLSCANASEPSQPKLWVKPLVLTARRSESLSWANNS